MEMEIPMIRIFTFSIIPSMNSARKERLKTSRIIGTTFGALPLFGKPPDFVDGGFRHDAAWNCYGPYLTLQLAHAYLLIGDVKKMDALLGWCVNAGFAKVSREGAPDDRWQVVLGVWNEQHCYPIAKDFAEVPNRWWYMGDIPHGWRAPSLTCCFATSSFLKQTRTACRIFIWLQESRLIGLGMASPLRCEMRQPSLELFLVID
jgi:hypothetical protein